jgi:hypothetical protein
MKKYSNTAWPVLWILVAGLLSILDTQFLTTLGVALCWLCAEIRISQLMHDLKIETDFANAILRARTSHNTESSKP